MLIWGWVDPASPSPAQDALYSELVLLQASKHGSELCFIWSVMYTYRYIYIFIYVRIYIYIGICIYIYIYVFVELLLVV